MTSEKLAALLARLDETEKRAVVATPGPWREGTSNVWAGEGSHEHVVLKTPDEALYPCNRDDPRIAISQEQSFADRTDVPALVAAVRTLQDRLLVIARHAARLSRRDDLADKEAIEKLLQVCSDCETWQSECARCAEATGKAAGDYLSNEEKVEKALARAEKAEAAAAALRDALLRECPSPRDDGKPCGYGLLADERGRAGQPGEV